MTTDREAVNLGHLARVYEWLKSSHFFPGRCCLCARPGEKGALLCRGCRDDLPWLLDACPRCATPMPNGQRVCGHCQQNPPPLDSTRALFHYRPPVTHLIQQLKFHQRLSMARLFGELLAGHLQSLDPRPQALLPVPLHPARQRERGFNQSLELARPIARAMNIPILTRHCVRQRHTEAQSGLHARQRLRNLKDAFSISRDLGDYQHIAILDDVITTGATVGELSRTLRAAGCQTIECWAIAKTTLQPTGIPQSPFSPLRGEG